MKKMMFTLIALLTMAAQANAMSYEQARREALFLTDKMAYELNLTDAQYEAAYEINLDYLMGVTSQYDVFGSYWERRNMDLSYILYQWQWDAFCAATYFYRPLFWDAGYWHFGIYARYPHRDYFYFGRPAFFATYRGGHSWRMNGGRSFYEGRRDFFRPDNRPRDQHFGMRNGWDRGDYRGSQPGGGHNSSTHVTAGNRPGDRPGTGGTGFGSNRNNGRSSFGNSRDNGSGTGHDRSNGGSFGGSRSNSGSFGGSRSSSPAPVRSSVGTTPRSSGSGSGGSLGTRNSGGSYGGGTRSSGGSHTGGTRSSGGTSNSHGNFGGSRR